MSIKDVITDGAPAAHNELRGGSLKQERSIMRIDIQELNNKYRKLAPRERVRQLYNDFNKVLVTSSFGTTSVLLLHIISEVNPGQEVFFLDTAYHFPETLAYKEKLKHRLALNITELRPDEWSNRFTTSDRTWSKDPDLCCSVNKVEPLESIKGNYEIWISGLMASQNDHRRQLDVFGKKDDIIRFYPLIDVKESEVEEYLQRNGLPQHPLRSKGYSSIGCIHCTVKGRGREGRWVSKSKTECGLHL